MAEYRIPDFLNRDNPEPTELGNAITEYEEKIGESWSTEGYYFTDEELTKIFKKCIKENRTFNDVIGYDPNALDENDLI